MEAKLTTIICSIGEILRRFEYGISLANDMEHDLISVERTLDYSKDYQSDIEIGYTTNI